MLNRWVGGLERLKLIEATMASVVFTEMEKPSKDTSASM
jgi:hypothetical protein